MNGDEVLFRQIHPEWVQDGLPTSQGFRPTPKDAGSLSVDRSTLCTAHDSYALHADVKQLATAGTWGVSVEEFAEVLVECRPDPIEATPTEPANAAHAVADFTPLPANRWKPVSQKLKTVAARRGRQHP